MNKSTIKVLLIDDNPEYAFCLKSTVPGLNKNILEDSSIQELPWISDQAYSDDYTITDRLKGVESYFELRWLQFHSDAFEFRNLSYEVKLKYGLQKLAEVGFVPDLIVFDYALTDAQAENSSTYLHYLKNDTINQFINPNCSLATFLKAMESKIVLLPRMKDYKDNSPKIRPDANYDSYGLFCGSMIAEMFKYETPIAAIPATRKGQTQINTEVYPAFFEWFLNDSYHKIFDRQHRTKKDWDSILKDGLLVYKEEIKNMVINGKIHIDLENLISLLNGDFLITEANERKITALKFSSAYGKRSIPLDGLFIDKEITRATDAPKELLEVANGRVVTERDKEIWKFLNDVAAALMTSSKLGSDISEISTAINNATSLLNRFDSVDFKKRLLLSHYYEKVSSLGSSPLSKDEQSLYDECLKYFTLNGDEITIPGEFSILSFASKGKQANKMVNRLTTFFVATILWERYSNYSNSLDDDATNSHSPDDQSQVGLIPPKVTDLLLALFPIWTNHIVLFNEKGTLLKKPVEAMGSKLKTHSGFDYSEIMDNGNGIDLRKQMTPGEYMIVKSFATSLDFINEPFWLKGYKYE